MASGDNSYNNSSNSYIAQPGYWCPSQYASPFPNQSIWQGTLRPETWSEQEALHYLPYSPASCSETSDSSSTASTTKRKRNTWSTAEEEILLNLCGEHKSGLKGSGSSQKWQQIADEVNRASDEINASSSLKTGTQCKDKWHNLLNAYKKAKDSSTKTGNDTKTMKAFKHFEQMDMFMGDKHEIAMPFVRNSSKSSVPATSATEASLNEDSSVSSRANATVSNRRISSPLSDLGKPSTSGVLLQDTDETSESPPKKGKSKKGKSPKKAKGKVKKDEQDDRWFDLFEKQTKVLESSQRGQEHYFQFLKESEERGRDLLITAIRELGTVLGGKKGKKRRAEEKLESSDED